MRAASAFGFSGAALVAQDGEVILRQGYGLANRATNAPVTLEMAFDIGSITKQFTAAAILQLEVQGKLTVGQPITVFFDSVPPDKTNITLHHLLTHTAGLPEYSGEDYDPASRDATVARILAAPLGSQIGSTFQYSNAGYSLLAAIVERVSGQPYETFLRESCFRPAGLAHTGYRLPAFNPKDLPHGYSAGADQGSPLDHAWAGDGPYWNLFGNGGMLSTVDDLFAWTNALQGNAILPDAARRKLFTPNLREYGYGWNVRDTPHGRRINHGGGSDNGFNAVVTWYPERNVTIIVTSNAGENENGLSFAAAVGTMLEHRVFDSSRPDVPDFQVVEIPRATLEGYVGAYRLTSGGTITVRLEGSQLQMEPFGQEATSLLALSPTENVRPYVDCSEKTAAIAEGLVKRDFSALRKSVPDSARAERYVKSLARTMTDLEEESGPLAGFDILGTAPAWWTTSDDLATLVRLRSAHGTRIFRLHWKDGAITAIGGDGIPSPARTPLAPISAGTFVGFHMGLARPVQVRFSKPVHRGAATLRLSARGQNVIARRVE